MWDLYSTLSSSIAVLGYFTILLPWIRPVSIQHTPELPREHTMHAAIISAVLLRHIAITSYWVLMSGWVNQSPHDSAVASNLQVLWSNLLNMPSCHNPSRNNTYSSMGFTMAEIWTKFTYIQNIHLNS